MLIQIECEESGAKEWALIELQGKIEPQHGQDMEGPSLPVGTMQLSKTVSEARCRVRRPRDVCYGQSHTSEHLDTRLSGSHAKISAAVATCEYVDNSKWKLTNATYDGKAI